MQSVSQFTINIIFIATVDLAPMNVNTGPTLKVPSQTPKSILRARRGYTGTASAATVEIEVCIMYYNHKF